MTSRSEAESSRCNRFWTEGIHLIERGVRDPHRAMCSDCRRAFAAHQTVVGALGRIGVEHSTPPDWEARVLQAIDAREKRRSCRWRVAACTLAASACALAVVCAIDRRADDPRPRVEIVPGPIAVRTAGVHTGDHVRITARLTDEIRAYRAERLVLRCRAPSGAPGCEAIGGALLVADIAVEVPGVYHLVVVSSRAPPPAGTFDRDLADLREAGQPIQLTEVSVP